MTRPFEARYGGICENCGERITPGDLARYEDDQLVHAGDACPRPAVGIRRTGAYCPNCWTEYALSGSCLCEED